MEARGPRRGLLRRRKARALARLRPRQRDGRVAADGHRAGGAPPVRQSYVARGLPRRVPGERDDGRIDRVVPRHRRRQHPRGAPGRLAGQALGRRPRGLSPRSELLRVRAAGGGCRDGREREPRRDQPGARRAGSLATLRRDLADVVAGRHGGSARGGAGPLPVGGAGSDEAAHATRSDRARTGAGVGRPRRRLRVRWARPRTDERLSARVSLRPTPRVRRVSLRPARCRDVRGAARRPGDPGHPGGPRPVRARLARTSPCSCCKRSW